MILKFSYEKRIFSIKNTKIWKGAKEKKYSLFNVRYESIVFDIANDISHKPRARVKIVRFRVPYIPLCKNKIKKKSHTNQNVLSTLKN